MGVATRFQGFQAFHVRYTVINRGAPQYLLDPSAEVEAAVGDFVQFLQEYGKL